LRDALAAEGHDCWPKTTGGKGLHVMVPIKAGMAWDAAHAYTRHIAERLAATAPACYVTSATVARGRRLFIDYLRNGRGTTAVGAYSPRARPGFPIAAPVTWRQIEDGLRSDAFSIGLLPSRTAQGKLHE
jgi:bifunctional non-homologous end joining protein LigD